jgi:P-type Ca2+ transporter type 2C
MDHPLTSGEAKERFIKYGPNVLKEIHKSGIKEILLRQIKSNYLVYVLLLASIVSFIVHHITTGIAILVVIAFMILFGFIQEYKAEKAIEALKSLLAPTITVIRDNKEVTLLTKELVPDDFILLKTGDIIPADCNIIEQNNLEVDESALTGESVPVLKKTPSKEIKDENKIFMGTSIVNGKCKAVITHTGMNTSFGKIAYRISTIEKQLPLQKKVNHLTTTMASIAVILSIFAGTILVLQAPELTREVFYGILVTIIALSVSAFPESFPVVLTIALASGARNMAKQNAIVNRMSSIESIGSVTTICTDKTGTITQGEMTARKVYTNNSTFSVSGSGYSKQGEIAFHNKKADLKQEKSLKKLLEACVLCNDSKIKLNPKDEFEINGSPTESSLMVLAYKAELFKESLSFENPKLDEIPFSSERKFTSTLHKTKRGTTQFFVGALEKVLTKCSYELIDNEKVKLSPQRLEEIFEKNTEFAKKGLRVISFAFKENNLKLEHSEFIFLGLVGINDPPRQEVKDSIKACKKAGIDVKMLTGDNQHTASAIAKEVGLNGKSLTGEDLDNLTDKELTVKLKDHDVFARINPEHKLRIVKLLQDKKEIVAMTGDGINDAPALKEADVGIAMGIRGTAVTREVSDIVLKDDNFATIVSAIEHGRTIFNNIRKFAGYQFSCNSAELFTIVVGVILQFPLPLLALQILFVNLITDNMPSVTLAFNPKSSDVMNVKPKNPESNILNKHILILIILFGATIGTGVLFSFKQGLAFSLDTARTMALTTLIIFEVFSAYNFRSFRKSIFKTKILKNKWLVLASLGSITALMLVIYTPLNNVFGTTGLPLNLLGLSALIALSIIFVAEIVKKAYGKKAKVFYN